jgi:hypothetical protein
MDSIKVVEANWMVRATGGFGRQRARPDKWLSLANWSIHGDALGRVAKWATKLNQIVCAERLLGGRPASILAGGQFSGSLQDFYHRQESIAQECTCRITSLKSQHFITRRFSLLEF